MKMYGNLPNTFDEVDIHQLELETHFQETFSRRRIAKGKRFIQDGCPVQNSKKARQALDTV